MEFKITPKQGYIFVEYVDMPNSTIFNNEFNLHGSVDCGIVKAGIKDIGMAVFFRDSIIFDEQGTLLLVKIEDVLAWIPQDEPKNDQA